MFSPAARETRRWQKAAAERVARAAGDVGRAFPIPADTASDEAWDLFAAVDELLAAVGAGLTKRGFRVGPGVAAGAQLALLREPERWSRCSAEQRAAIDELESAFRAIF